MMKKLSTVISSMQFTLTVFPLCKRGPPATNCMSWCMAAQRVFSGHRATPPENHDLEPGDSTAATSWLCHQTLFHKEEGRRVGVPQKNKYWWHCKLFTVTSNRGLPAAISKGEHGVCSRFLFSNILT